MTRRRLRQRIFDEAELRGWHTWLVPSAQSEGWEVHNHDTYWSSRWSTRTVSLDDAFTVARLWSGRA